MSRQSCCPLCDGCSAFEGWPRAAQTVLPLSVDSNLSDVATRHSNDNWQPFAVHCYEVVLQDQDIGRHLCCSEHATPP